MSHLANFLDRLRQHASLPCLYSGEQAYSYAELLHEIERWQTRLQHWQIPPGSVIGVRADYSLAAVALLIAVFVRHSVAALIPRQGDAIRYLQDACACLLIDLDSDGAFRRQSTPRPRNHPLLEQLRSSDEGGVVIFTSGSTGYPKAALQSVERFLYKFRNPGRRFRTLAFLLFDHVAGLDTLCYTLANGGALILTQQRDPAAILRLIDSHQVEVLPASPSFLRLLCAAGSTGHHLSSLEIITYGAEPMDALTLQRLNARFPQVCISQKYGTTETGSPRSASRGNDSLWLKLKDNDVETRIVDDILWIRSKGTMLGYLNAPSPVDEQGWYCTGDLVDVDGDWIRFRGRASQIINVGGEKVAPVEVEQVILELDFVRDVSVSGKPHPLMGEVVAAQVTLTNITANTITSAVADTKETAKRIRLHCRQRLAAHKVPVEINIVAGSLINDRQKTQRAPSSK